MKRLLFLSLCILFVGAMVARAETVTVTETRSVFNATYDEIDLTIASITGTDVPSGLYVDGTLGTWTLPSGGYFNMNSATSSNTWAAKLSNNGDAQDQVGPPTWLNFGMLTADARSRTGKNGSDATQWNSFKVGYSADATNMTGDANAKYNYFLGPVDLTPGDDGVTDSSGDPASGNNFDNTLLAKLFVTHATPSLEGWTLFSGVANYTGSLGGNSHNSIATSIIVGTVITPEPASLAMLGCGLFGLLAYAWRKRK